MRTLFLLRSLDYGGDERQLPLLAPGDPDTPALAMQAAFDDPPDGRRGHIDRLFARETMVETTERALSALISDGSHP